MKKLLLLLSIFVTLACSATTMTTAERNALALDASDAGFYVWDSDLSAFMIWAGTSWIGYPLGVPYAPQVGEKKIGIVAGRMIQDSANRTHWNYVSNSTSRPIGVLGTYATASGSQIDVRYSDTSYTHVLSFVVAPDEEWANVAGAVFGASVGLTNAIIKASSYLNGAYSLRYTGSNWVTAVSGTTLSPSGLNYSAGVITITNTYCRGIGVSVSPWSVSGTITNPYMPIIHSIANEYINIQWMDPVSGNLISAASPTNRMTANVFKVNNGGLFLDGSNGATNFLTVDMAVSGEVAFFGIFEK